MSAPATTHELISLIHKSGIADPASLSDRLRELDALPPTPTQSAAVLVQRGVLTKFQAKLLLTGRFRGFKLGPYIVQEHLGQGGMGAVYLAEHETLKRRVAVKVLTQPKGDQQGKLALERFLREARAAAALDHPNIVRVHDVSKQGDVHFLVLEYVDGQTLEQLTAAAGAVPPGRAVSLIAQAAAGLQHAYEKGFVHRDIKPANLMLTKDGTVKVLDMGLARSLAGEGDKLTERMDEGAIVGTADFISPEQAMNLPNIDIRSDIYSLGATFFALVTGKPPFSGNTTQKLVQHQMKDPPSLDSIDRTVPPELAVVVARMLHKKPEKRYQTPAEVITALAPWLTEAGATKIVAGLSGTDLAGSVEMQNTLNEIVQGGTTRIGKSKRLAGKKRPVGVWAGTAAAVLVACGVVAGAVLGLSGGSSGKPIAGIPPVSGPPVSGPPTVVPAVTPPKKSPAVARTVTSVPKRPAAASVFRFDATVIPECRFTLRGFEPTSGVKPVLPNGFNMHCWKEGSAGGFVRATTAGRPAVGVGSREGDPTAQFSISLTEAFQPDLGADRDLTVRVEYLTQGTAGNFVISNKTANYTGLGGVNLEETGGQWRTAEVVFRRPAGAHIQLAVDSNNVSAAGFVFVHSIEVLDPAAAPPPAYRIDFAGFQPGKTEVRQRNEYGSQVAGQQLPPGLGLNHYNKAADADYLIDDKAGVRAFGMRCLGGGACQVMLVIDDVFAQLTGGRTGTLRLTYQYEGGNAGGTSVQLNKEPWTKGRGVPLPATNGAWQTAELPLTRPDDNRYAVVIHTGFSESGTLWLKEVSAHIDAPLPPVTGAAGVLYQLDLSGAAAAANRGGGEATGDPAEDVRFVRRSGAGELPAGWRGIPWDLDSEAEFLVGTVDNRSAVGMKNVRLGSASPQAFTGMLFAPRLDFPAGPVKVRFTYRTDGGGPNSCQLKFKPTGPTAGKAWEVPGCEKLVGTAGQWVTHEVEVDLKGATAGYFEFHSFDGDPSRGAYLAEFEVSSANAVARRPGSVLQLDPVQLLAFRSKYTTELDPQEPNNRAKKRSRLLAHAGDGQLPADWYARPIGPGDEMEVFVESLDGANALGIQNVAGKPPAMLFSSVAQIPNRTLRVRLTYRTAGVTGTRPFLCRFKALTPSMREAGDLMPLAPTYGEWKTVEQEVDLADAATGRFEFHNNVPAGPDPNGLWVREFEVINPAAAAAPAARSPAGAALADGPTLYNLDMPAKAFRYTLADGKADPPTAAEFFPAGVYAHCWKPESVAEVRGEPTDAGVAVGVTNLNDTLSSQLKFDFEGGIALKLKPGAEYKARVEYRTAGDAFGVANARTPGDGYKAIGRAELPGTGGAWRSAEFVFRRAAHGVDLTVENLAVGEGNTLYVRKLELIERVPATAAAARPAAQTAPPPAQAVSSATVTLLDPGSLPAFAASYTQAKQAGGTAPQLPAGFGIQAYDKGTVGKAWTETIGGRPAVGLANESGKSSMQVYFDTHGPGRPPAVEAGRRYVLRLDYLTRADATANVQVQVHGKWDQKPGFLKLEPTRGQWQTAEVPFDSGTEPLRVNVNNTAAGGGNPLYVARFELVRVD